MSDPLNLVFGALADPNRRQVIGYLSERGTATATELTGELTEFCKNLTRTYHHIEYEELKFHLIEAGPKIMPEMERELADYAVKVFRKRDVDVRTNMPAKQIEPGTGGDERV